MTEADKIEELAKWFETTFLALHGGSDWWGYKQAAFLRSLSTRLKELEEKEEALEWLIGNHYLSHMHHQRNLPPYLRKRLGKEG